MEKQTTFQINITQRRRRLANVRITVSKQFTECDGVAWGNENGIPLAMGLLLYAAHNFAPNGSIKDAIELAIQEYDPSAEFGDPGLKSRTARQPGLLGDDIPF